MKKFVSKLLNQNRLGFPKFMPKSNSVIFSPNCPQNYHEQIKEHPYHLNESLGGKIYQFHDELWKTDSNLWWLNPDIYNSVTFTVSNARVTKWSNYLRFDESNFELIYDVLDFINEESSDDWILTYIGPVFETEVDQWNRSCEIQKPFFELNFRFMDAGDAIHTKFTWGDR